MVWVTGWWRVKLCFCKQLMQRYFLKRVNAQKLQSSVQGAGQSELLVQDGHQQVSRNRNPDLRLHRVGTVPEKMFDAQVSLDPAEEQFDLPAQSINSGDDHGWDFQMIGQKDQMARGLQVEVMHPAQGPRKSRSRSRQGRLSSLVAAHSPSPGRP